MKIRCATLREGLLARFHILYTYSARKAKKAVSFSLCGCVLLFFLSIKRIQVVLIFTSTRRIFLAFCWPDGFQSAHLDILSMMMTKMMMMMYSH